MGKYAATKAIQGNKHWRSTAITVGDSFTGDIKSESDYAIASFLYNGDPTGIYRGYIASRDNTRWMRDYLANHGLEWSDIKYLSRTFSGDGGFARNSLSVSSNIARLYL